MEKKKFKAKRKAVVSREECVACGSCVKVCRLEAVKVHRGIFAKINEETCVGCARCSAVCPASVIAMEELAG